MCPVRGGRCKCSFRHAPLPAMRLVSVLTFALVAALPAAGAAQTSLAVAADARARPGGAIVASLNPGARVTPGAAQGSETAVTIEGWVDASRLGARRDSFPASVSGRLTLRVRAQPTQNGTIIAVLQPGSGVHTLGRQGTWMRVRRTLWIPSASLRRSTATAPAATAPAPAAPAAASGNPDTKAAPAPNGPAAGTAANALVGTGGARLQCRRGRWPLSRRRAHSALAPLWCLGCLMPPLARQEPARSQPVRLLWSAEATRWESTVCGAPASMCPAGQACVHRCRAEARR